MKQEKPNLDDRASRLRVARLALVQAIYQNALAPLPDEALLRQFQESRAFQEQMEVPKQVWDHFERVLTGVLRDQSFLDDFLSRIFLRAGLSRAWTRLFMRFCSPPLMSFFAARMFR